MNKFLKGLLIVLGLIVIIAISLLTRPNRLSEPEKTLVAKIEKIEYFRDKAEAMAVSLPLVSDSIVKNYSNNIHANLIDLNRTWIVFVNTEKNFKEYTVTVDELNKSLETLLIKYETEKMLRILQHSIKDLNRESGSEKENFDNNTLMI